MDMGSGYSIRLCYYEGMYICTLVILPPLCRSYALAYCSGQTLMPRSPMRHATVACWIRLRSNFTQPW